MIVFVLGSIFMGFAAGAYAVFAGSSLLFAVLVYSAAGIFTIALVLLRAYICQILSDASKPLEA